MCKTVECTIAVSSIRIKIKRIVHKIGVVKFLGHPFNVSQAAFWVYMLAQQCNLEVGELIMSIGDAHIYTNHFEQVETKLKREPTPLPKLKLVRKPESIYDYRLEDFELVDYNPQPAIKGKVAI